MAEDIQCHVDGITSGNSFSCVMAEGLHIGVRLDNIDAPELTQPYGRESLLLLADLIFGKTVTIAPRGTDLYGDTVAKVTHEGVNISREMVRLGGALVLDAFNCDALLSEIEDEAKAARRGLWHLPENNFTEPWKGQIRWQVKECPH